MTTTKTPEEWIEIFIKVRDSGKMANTLAKALAKRYSHRWQFVDFLGPAGQESAGVVDIVAIRKSGKKPTIAGLKSLDLFDIILIQVKGGSAGMPKSDDLSRLRLVQQHYEAHEVVLFEWNKKKALTQFSVLNESNEWSEKSPAEIFGKAGKVKKSKRLTASDSTLSSKASEAAKRAWVTRKANKVAVDTK